MTLGSNLPMRALLALTMFSFLIASKCIAAEDPFAAVTADVRAVCTQPSTQGEHWALSGDASGEAGIQIRLLKVAGVKGALHFTKEEWSGVQRVLQADQARDNADYRQCARDLTPKFLAKVRQISKNVACENSPYSNCALINNGTQVVEGSTPPPPRIITEAAADSAVAILQTAPRQSTVFLIYSGKNGVDEIEKFYGQVADLFRNADHWQIVGPGPERIGPEMGLAGGGRLTGEGIGCSEGDPRGNAAQIVKQAMEATGYGCMREAANYGPHGWGPDFKRKPETANVLVSIGSRFVPPE